MCIAAALVSPLPIQAQVAQNATAAATVTANPKHVASADAIISALYDANTIMVDQKKDVDRFRSLFVPGARLMPTPTVEERVAELRVG